MEFTVLVGTKMYFEGFFPKGVRIIRVVNGHVGSLLNGRVTGVFHVL